MEKNDNQKFLMPNIGTAMPHSIRTMDEVVVWIDEVYDDFFDRELYEKEKRRLSVSQPFTLRP